MADCTVSGNTAPGTIFGPGGGSLLNNGTLTMTNCTVSNNSAYGVVSLGGTVTMNNTIVAGNTGSNVIGSSIGSNNLIGGDPVLAPLGNYGGPTQTMPELPGSPALGAGSVALAVDPHGNPLTTDQRGLPRLTNGSVDIGVPVVWIHDRLHLGKRPDGKRRVSRTAGRDRHGEQLD